MKQITCPHCGDTYPDFDVAHVCSKGPYAPKLKPKMNERIRELAEHCDFYVGNEHYNESHEEKQRLWTEKFAELIVRECAKVVFEKTGPKSALNVLEHFGVEE